MEKLYKREKYLSKLRGFYHDTDMIKVLSGVRRCGKSSIMELIRNELIENGADPMNIIFLNLDSKEYLEITTIKKLQKLIDKLVKNVNGTKYLFIDEVQNVKGFEKLINAYREEKDYSIFITGSNSYLLSGELATKLTGRYIEFNINTLTFEEYIEMKKFLNIKISSDLDEEFFNYIKEGGFPLALKYKSDNEKRIYIKSVINEIYEKDIKRNKKIKNKSLFNIIQTYIINNFGSTTSVNSIVEYLKNNSKIKTAKITIYNYLKILENAKIISKCERFDMKSKKSLNGSEKYYLSDLSFFFATNTDNRIEWGPVLENIVFNYLKSKDYSLSIGKIGKLEVDFIARNIENEYLYIQVCKTIDNDNYDENGKNITEEREYRSLESIKDGYSKYLLSLDKLLQKRNGIKHLNIIDVMINNKI